MNVVKVSTKGAVVIPKEMRDKYQLKPGDKVHFIDYGGVISIVPVSKNPIEDGVGLLKGKKYLTTALSKAREEDINLEK